MLKRILLTGIFFIYHHKLSLSYVILCVSIDIKWLKKDVIYKARILVLQLVDSNVIEVNEVNLVICKTNNP